jgi:CDP-diacylglycerol--serine O-phosphatidyltransferase
VWAWTVAIAALLISRIPTLSLKTVKAPAKAIAPLLLGVALLAAAIIQFPLVALIAAMILYLAHIPYSVYRHRWLAAHPEAWTVPPRERRAIRRASPRRLGLRRPLRRRVAGAAMRAVRLPRTGETVRTPRASENGQGPRRRSWRQIGLRRK